MPGMGGCGIPPCGVIGGNIPGGVGVSMGAGGGCSGIKRGCSGGLRHSQNTFQYQTNRLKTSKKQ